MGEASEAEYIGGESEIYLTEGNTVTEFQKRSSVGEFWVRIWVAELSGG